MIGLLIAAEDIQNIQIGLFENDVLLKEQTVNVQPDGYLSAIESTLERWKTPIEAIERIAVVTGPGSFTSSRVSISLVNAIGYALSVPVVGIENPKRLSLEALVRKLPLSDAGGFVQPAYDRPPHITLKKE